MKSVLYFLPLLISATAFIVTENMINTNEEYPGKGIELIPNTDLVLQCNTTDNPPQNVQWLKNGIPLNMTDTRLYVENSNNSLIVLKATEADTGKYTCVTADGAANATIVVRTKVKLLPMDNSRNVVQGQNVVLHCNVTQGIPPPVLQWYKDDKPMNLSDSRIETKMDDKGIENAQLTLKDVDFDDRAEYMCLASNELGSANVTILVRVKDKYAALWPFLGICAEVAVLCTIIFIYEKRRQKPDFDESENENNTENKNVPDQEEKTQDIRQRK